MENCLHSVPHPRSEVPRDDCIICADRAALSGGIQRLERGLHVVNEEGATEEGYEDIVGVSIGRATAWVTLQRVEGLDALIHKAAVHVGGHEGIVERQVGAIGAGGVGEDVGCRGGVAGAAGERDGKGKLGERGRRRERATE